MNIFCWYIQYHKASGLAYEGHYQNSIFITFLSLVRKHKYISRNLSYSAQRISRRWTSSTTLWLVVGPVSSLAKVAAISSVVASRAFQFTLPITVDTLGEKLFPWKFWFTFLWNPNISNSAAGFKLLKKIPTLHNDLTCPSDINNNITSKRSTITDKENAEVSYTC